jgi:hypothetical protein
MDEHEQQALQPAVSKVRGFSPTFVCRLSDARHVRMSCFCPSRKLRPEDYAKGLRLVGTVLETAERFRENRPTPVCWWFEDGGEILDGKVEAEATAKQKAAESQAIPAPGHKGAAGKKNAAGKPPGGSGALFGGNV